MGREVRRVPVDWDWPLEEIWEGFQSPKWRECPNEDCFNGSTTAGEWVSKIIYPLLMLDEAAITGKLHPWLQQLPLAPTKKREGADWRDPYAYEHVHVSKDIIDFCTALADRPASGFGHDAIDQWHMFKKIVEAAGLPEDYFTCKTCKGSAIHPDDYEASEAWERTDPPTGEGWQVWETVSEGSPITPVFPTAEELIDYLATKGTTWDQKPSAFDRERGPWRREAAEQFVKDGFAMSFITSSGPDGMKMFEGARDADLLEAERSST